MTGETREDKTEPTDCDMIKFAAKEYDFRLEKKYVDEDEWIRIWNFDNWKKEYYKIKGNYIDPTLLIFDGSVFRTPTAFYRVTKKG